MKDIKLEGINDLNMAFIFFNPVYSGIIIGPRTSKQMSSTYESWKRLMALDSNELTKSKTFINELHRVINRCL